LYIDYDGVRADYAVTDTYGRNAVWSDYVAVYHYNENPSGTEPQLTDSTGNGHNGTSAGSMTSGQLVDAKLGKGWEFDASNDIVTVPNATALNPTQITTQCWTRFITGTVDHELVWKPQNAGWTTPFLQYGLRLQTRAAANTDRPIFFINGGGTLRSAQGTLRNLNTTQFYSLYGTYDGSNLRIYFDGVLEATTPYTGSIASGTQTLRMGNNNISTQWGESFLDEVRIKGSALSANWITTEYNNQSDEATFWGAWTDAGGAPPTANNGFMLWW
jgi:hypothetical protein